GEEQRASVFLSDIEEDPGEHENLAEVLPELTASLKEDALAWRKRMEDNWASEFAENYRNLT
ncbi:MAG: hypothetical protein IK133_08120, partial [Clostridia bacterium]|nr:hypothetical protein [Clostridia bacterium]